MTKQQSSEMNPDVSSSCNCNACLIAAMQVETLGKKVFELEFMMSRLMRALSYSESEKEATFMVALQKATVEEKVIAMELAMEHKKKLEELAAPESVHKAKNQQIEAIMKSLSALQEQSLKDYSKSKSLENTNLLVQNLDSVLCHFAMHDYVSHLPSEDEIIELLEI